MSQATAPEYLTRASLLRLLVVLSLVVAPHALRLPLWVSLLTVAVVAWRAVAAIRLWPMPPQWLKLALALGAFVAVYASFGRREGQEAGTALLVVMLALKLAEMRARRDVMVVISLFYFLVMTHFLFSQELWTVVYLLGCTLIITALLIEASHPGVALAPRQTLPRAGIMVAQALPIMLALFVLFPRIPGPLWGLPANAGAGRTGLSEEMTPGDIAQLVQSDEVAFRVRFEDRPPPSTMRYWRGPVLWTFDGRTWDFGARALLTSRRAPAPVVEYLGEPVDYQVILEPHGRRWLFAIDLPDVRSLPADTRVTYDLQLQSEKPLMERRAYPIQSYPQHRFQQELPAEVHEVLVALPQRGNPRARALARQWRAEAASDIEIVQRALRMFSDEEFFYTLRPPPLGEDTVDDFLFGTRRGFCEHYAGSFTFLMRAAGLPARVVTGYQGGELNELGGYYVVRQSDAHAWSEVWLEGRGWVRADPTAAVSPARIERGIAASMTAADGLPSFLVDSYRGDWRYALALRWDLANMYWNEWVLAYGPALQQSFLQRFGLGDWTRMILALTALIAVILGAVGWMALRRAAPVRSQDRALLLWQQALGRLARLGLHQHPAEGPRDFAARVRQERPELGAAIDAITDSYVGARYLDPSDPRHEAALSAALRRLHD